MFLRGEHTTNTCYHVNVDMSLDKAKTIPVAQHLLVQQYLSFTNGHYSLDQPTACTGWVGGGGGGGGGGVGGYWVNNWGKVYAKRAINKTVGSSKAYQQARNLQLLLNQFIAL